MLANADDAPVGGVIGLPNFVSPVTSARCRIFRRHGWPVFAASLLRNVFARVDMNLLDRNLVDATDRFVHRPLATASESSFEPLCVFASLREVRPSFGHCTA